MGTTLEETRKLLRRKAVVKLDVGCGKNRKAGWIGMDFRKYPGVDIVHNIEIFPWPIPDNSIFQILLCHVWEHVEPKYRITLMDELWRIVRPDGQLLITSPYARSHGADMDPTHYGCPNETTFHYFDPCSASGLHAFYESKPWHLVDNHYDMNSSVRVVMEPRKK